MFDCGFAILRPGLSIGGVPAGRSMSSRGRRAGKGKYSDSRSRSGRGAGVEGRAGLVGGGFAVVVGSVVVEVTAGLVVVAGIVVCMVVGGVVTVGLVDVCTRTCVVFTHGGFVGFICQGFGVHTGFSNHGFVAQGL